MGINFEDTASSPHWTADWLHREAQAWLDMTAQQGYQQTFSALDPELQAVFSSGAVRNKGRDNSSFDRQKN
ncbi:hypothetical protein CXF72_17955 [Psychromonas sp. MB-3u-54]|uniref:hypothetical protein n=1 Tax=Psychromonas sp. MB-3u-54 TaxID=2058319 RepID=UPI000C326202|nr:hypothetical protein [Psychromonas sp. MB-3u-54]PKH01295.1 hypothetical protein CXF72_17955 [Psychromonas sp. MB-3u-54]